MENLDLITIKKRSIIGVVSLTVRTFLLQVIAFAGYFFITIFLDQKELGLFILISAVIDILTYFSDIGLAAALIQKKEKLKLKEIRSTFTIQEGLVLGGIVLLLFLSPLIKKIYNLNQDGLLLLYSFAFSFFLSSLKTIPSVLLERKLEFDKIVIPQIVETIVFNLVVVFFAWKGWGIKSYIIAVLARAVSGTFLIYFLAPWKIGLAFSKKDLKKLLKFGVPYQANTLLAVVKDKFMILFLGKIIGQSGLGLVGWAEKWANMPLRYFLDNTNKVAFPAFARLQNQKPQLQKAIEACLYFLSILVFPSLVGLSLLAGDLIKLIPRYEKWEPALLPLYFYSFTAAWATISTLLTNALTAVGKIKIVFKLMIMWTALTWIFTPLLAIKLGFLGVALASALVSLSSLIAIIETKRNINFNLLSNISPSLLSSMIMGFFLFLVGDKISLSLSSVLIKIVGGGLVYFLSLYLINKDKLFQKIKVILDNEKE